MTVASDKVSRLNVRLDDSIKGLIEQAAALLGQSVSSFAVSTLAERARTIVDEHTTIRLTDRERDKFLTMLEQDTKPNARLKAAAKAYRRRVAR